MAQQTHNTQETTGWVGWIYFAETLMMLAGIFQFIVGLVAILKDDVFVLGPNSALVLDFAQWGWAHMIIGGVLFLSSFSVLAGGAWGRFFGSVIAGLSAIANFTFITIYPVWATIVIVIDVLVIYALLVHGREVKTE